MSHPINTTIKIPQLPKQEPLYIDTQKNIKNKKNLPTSEARKNNPETLLTSRKQAIQETRNCYLGHQKNTDSAKKTEPFTRISSFTKYFEHQENQLQSIKQKLEHTPFVFQQLFEKTIIKTTNNHQQNKKETKKRDKKKDTIILTNYWDNRSPLFTLGKNAETLKNSLSKGNKKTKIRLPENFTKQLNSQDEKHPLLEPDYWNKIIEYWLSLSPNGRLKSIETWLQPTTIHHSDPRKKLHGQYGVLAARDIPSCTVIAPYSGLYCIGSDILREKACYGANVGRYAVNCSTDSVQINLCGYGHGNITLCINANTTYIDGDPVLDDNTCFALILYQGWPYIFVISTRKITRNSEVLIDYGRNYWKGYG